MASLNRRYAAFRCVGPGEKDLGINLHTVNKGLCHAERRRPYRDASGSGAMVAPATSVPCRSSMIVNRRMRDDIYHRHRVHKAMAARWTNSWSIMKHCFPPFQGRNHRPVHADRSGGGSDDEVDDGRNNCWRTSVWLSLAGGASHGVLRGEHTGSAFNATHKSNVRKSDIRAGSVARWR